MSLNFVQHALLISDKQHLYSVIKYYKFMKLKFALLISLLLFVVLPLSAQDYKVNIEKDFKRLNDLFLSGKYEEAMDLFPERIFEVASREQLAAAFSQIMNNKDVKTVILDYKVLDISTPEEVEGKFYAAFKYKTSMTMSFTPQSRSQKRRKSAGFKG